MYDLEREQIGQKTIYITILLNVFLSIIKLVAGIVGKSSSMISDAVHSLSDVFSSVGVLIGLKIAGKPADADHPYGHEKFEPILTKILAFILFITGVSIGSSAISTISSGQFTTPGMIALWAAILSIVVKEWMYHYTLIKAKKIDSTALAADAWHHRTDALSSVGALIGIAGARMGFPILDPLASLVITVIILKAAVDIFIAATNQLVDKSATPEIISEIKDCILEVPGVVTIDSLKTRIHSNRIYMDLEIGVNPNLSLIAAHEIAEAVHDNIETKMSKIKHCTVHVNPVKELSQDKEVAA